MSWFHRLDLIDPYTCSPLIVRETSIVEPSSLFLGFPSFIDEDVEDLFDFSSPSPLDLFETVTDLVQIEKSPSSCKYKVIRRRLEPEYPLKYLCDRVSDLESKFDRLVSPKSDRKYTLTKEIKGSGERKYRWEAEIQGPPERKYKLEAEIEGSGERKYKWTTEIKGGKKDEEGLKLAALKKEKAKAKAIAAAEAEKKNKKKKKSYNWTTEVKSERENGEVSHTYIIKASTGGEKKKKHEEKEKKEKKEKVETKSKKKEKTRVVVIEEEEEEDDESAEHGAIVLRKAFSRRTGAVRTKKGKNKEMPPEYAAVMIQRAFKAYLIRRSKSLRALRDLAIAKTKLKELRASFHNFSYRRLISRDAEERQKFSEKIIVLLLTVDAIEGVDVMVRGAKRSMVDELEAMLDVVDPQPQGKSLSMRRRTFDMPDSLIRKEIADGVTQIVQMLETEEE
ncbi:IQ motif EF-hand binding site [Arabidopsis suecica]|uniref:IQ motif EF-hand binding site n=1 Tax=Arabidopsis suecica TaxID=45249 RepID=A0A8T1XXL7_ARASU|nr:IQ motif EF-hand binding site [Arabidopsis suecica]